nr:hypothetical protein CFP56_37226 [Quercus suber]
MDFEPGHGFCPSAVLCLAKSTRARSNEFQRTSTEGLVETHARETPAGDKLHNQRGTFTSCRELYFALVLLAPQRRCFRDRRPAQIDGQAQSLRNRHQSSLRVPYFHDRVHSPFDHALGPDPREDPFGTFLRQTVLDLDRHVGRGIPARRGPGMVLLGRRQTFSRPFRGVCGIGLGRVGRVRIEILQRRDAVIEELAEHVGMPAFLGIEASDPVLVDRLLGVRPPRHGKNDLAESHVDGGPPVGNIVQHPVRIRMRFDFREIDWWQTGYDGVVHGHVDSLVSFEIDVPGVFGQP